MRRLLVVTLVTSVVVGLGCGGSYQKRVASHMDKLRYQQRLDQFLQQHDADLLAKGIYLRPPKPLVLAQAFGLSTSEGMFDATATFLDQTPAPDAEKKKAAATDSRRLRLHILARITRPQAAAKKGEEPPQPTIERGEFQADIRSLLSGDMNSAEAQTNGVKKVTHGPASSSQTNEFSELTFNSSTDELVKVDFYEPSGPYKLALVWVIPPDKQGSPTMTTGSILTLESLAVGPRAEAKSRGADVDEMIVPGQGGAAVPGGQPF